uniref:C2 domain-containing protein n=1 Tax=Caenorhabditis japonica TaxID=281687 RepID=A0A8R1HFP7_CAEJA
MEELINSTEKTSFTSQWHGSLQSVRVSAQIEGSTALNPFGLIAKCDQGFYPKISFNQSSLDVWERLTVRVITIDSQCFSVKILVKLDTECPYCPIPTSTVMVTTSHSSFTLTSQQNLILCALIMALFTILSISVFLFTLRRIMKLRRRDSFKQFPSLDSGISSIAPLSYSDDIGSGEEKNSRFVDFFSVLPPDIDYDDIDEESIDIQKIPRLGSLVYSLFPTESDLSISDPLYV